MLVLNRHCCTGFCTIDIPESFNVLNDEIMNENAITLIVRVNYIFDSMHLVPRCLRMTKCFCPIYAEFIRMSTEEQKTRKVWSDIEEIKEDLFPAKGIVLRKAQLNRS